MNKIPFTKLAASPAQLLANQDGDLRFPLLSSLPQIIGNLPPSTRFRARTFEPSLQAQGEINADARSWLL
ncbi:MAG: hypothetical protein AB7E59_14900 [Pusillimonas sp.]